MLKHVQVIWNQNPHSSNVRAQPKCNNTTHPRPPVICYLFSLLQLHLRVSWICQFLGWNPKLQPSTGMAGYPKLIAHSWLCLLTLKPQLFTFSTELLKMAFIIANLMGRACVRATAEWWRHSSICDSVGWVLSGIEVHIWPINHGPWSSSSPQPAQATKQPFSTMPVGSAHWWMKANGKARSLRGPSTLVTLRKLKPDWQVSRP